LLDSKGMWLRLKSKFRRYFLAGILVVVPGAVAILVLYWLVTWLAGLLQLGIIPLILHSLVPTPTNPFLFKLYEYGLLFGDFLLGALLALAVVLIVGAFAQSLLVRRLELAGARFFDRIPVLGIIYRASRQLIGGILTETGTQFLKVVLVQYPNENSWVLGLVSSECGPAVSKAMGEKCFFVFIPTTPNPTNGFLIVAPERSMRDVDLSVNRAFEIIISGGLIGEQYSAGANLPGGSR